MWYERNEPKPLLDYRKPIMATHSDGSYKHILLPYIVTGSYAIKGWNWFNIKEGTWASCSTFETVEKALKARAGYVLTNVYIDVEEV